MDIKSMAVQMLMAKLGGGDSNAIGSALSGLLGGGSDDDGLDVGGMVEKFSGGDTGDAVKSWLGDGDNAAVSGDQVKNALGADKVSQFAQQLGIGEEEAAGGLSDLLPQLIDKSSSGGSLLGGVMGMASKLLK